MSMKGVRVSEAVCAGLGSHCFRMVWDVSGVLLDQEGVFMCDLFGYG